MILPGLITAIAFFILILKTKRDTQRLIYGYDIPVDIAATVVMTALFSGTYAGMMAAIIGGLVFSGLLMLMKKLRGYRKIILTVNHVEHSRIPNVHVDWVDVPGIFASRKETRHARAR